MASIDAQMAAVAAMSPAELRSHWRDTFRRPPPPVSPDMLARTIAYRIQERAHGGLSRSMVKEISRLSRRVARTGSAADANDLFLKTGTRLVRSWRGKTQSVLVCEGGFQFENRNYASLTQIARDITGTNWSGPRFFGLKKRRGPPTRAAADE